MAMNQNYNNPGAVMGALVLVIIAVCIEACSCCCTFKIMQSNDDSQIQGNVICKVIATSIAGILVLIAAFLENSAKTAV